MQYTHETTQQWRLRTIHRLQTMGLITHEKAELLRAAEAIDPPSVTALKAETDKRIADMGNGFARLLFANGSSQTGSQP